MKAIVLDVESALDLSKLLLHLERGNEVVLTRAGKPIARVVPLARGLPRRAGGRKGGQLAGRIRMSRDFDAPLPPEIASPLGILPE